MDLSELQRLSDLNVLESVRDQARWTKAGEIVESDGVMRVVSATRFPVGTMNCAMLTRKREHDLDALIHDLSAFYAARDRGYTIKLCGERDAALERECEKQGLFKAAENPGMVLDAPLKEPALPAGVRLETVRDAAAMRQLADVEARAYATMGMPQQVADKMFGAPELMLDPHWHYVLAYLDDKPAAGAMVLLSHGIAGVYWVGCVPEARKRGLAEIVTRRVGNWGFEQGARTVVLQASDMGEPVYRRMGYRVFSRYPWYSRPKAKS